jgi:hypothetical protein
MEVQPLGAVDQGVKAIRNLAGGWVGVVFRQVIADKHKTDVQVLHFRILAGRCRRLNELVQLSYSDENFDRSAEFAKPAKLLPAMQTEIRAVGRIAVHRVNLAATRRARRALWVVPLLKLSEPGVDAHGAISFRLSNVIGL